MLNLYITGLVGTGIYLIFYSLIFFNIFFFLPFAINFYYGFFRFGTWDSFYTSTSICGFVVWLYKGRIISLLMRVIRFIFNILLFIFNIYKAYYKYSKIEYAKYNTYNESTQLSASVLDINISVKIFKESFKYISK